MLQRPLLPTPSSGAWREHECPRCGREVDLPLGALCEPCAGFVERRARRLARRAAIVAAGLFGAWILWTVPPDPNARMVAAGGLLIVWLIVRSIVLRAVREWHG